MQSRLGDDDTIADGELKENGNTHRNVFNSCPGHVGSKPLTLKCLSMPLLASWAKANVYIYFCQPFYS